MDPKTLRFRLGLFVITTAVLLAVLILLFGGSVGGLFVRQNEYIIALKEAPGQYEIVLQTWKYVDYKKAADGEFTNSKFVDISNKVGYKI